MQYNNQKTCANCFYIRGWTLPLESFKEEIGAFLSVNVAGLGTIPHVSDDHPNSPCMGQLDTPLQLVELSVNFVF